ncbi:MAG: nucleotide exchange factor GrpE [Verrucomicrobiales bacterium]|jgi:molecular chaperone GrpE|nr:nucleotide exchange factor GrpE [Verrucomicrobiales bacterium]|tara:strand:- start:46 stop:666 length:621 start_codon:yes stop_codon:yes gene_type:complete
MSDKKTPPKTEKDSESTDIESDIEEVESSNVNESDDMNSDSSEEIILDPLEESTKEAAHWKDLAARNQAELDNYRKRMAREKSDAIKFANGSLLSELLPVIDSFQMGLTAAINEDPDSIISKGMEMVQKQLEEFFSSQGAVAISSVGNEFDPNLHEAISQESSDEVPNGHIITEIRKGYTLNDRLLRAANVIVSKGPESADNENDS